MGSIIGPNGDQSDAGSPFWRDGRGKGFGRRRADYVLIASDIPLVAEGLLELLSSKCSEFEFMLQTDTRNQKPGEDAHPTLIVVQTTEFRSDHPWLLKFKRSMRQRYPDAPLLLISELPVNQVSWSPLESGFAGYIPTSQSSDQLVSAIRVLAKGGGLLLHSREAEYKM